MDEKLIITERELKEIHHALWYERFGNHGTVGHNMLILISKMARFQGFWITDGGTIVTPDYVMVITPDYVTVEPEKSRNANS